MINNVSFAIPHYRQAPAFKATPQQIVEMVEKLETKGGMTVPDFAMEMEDEKAVNLDKAAKILEEKKHPSAKMLRQMAEIAKEFE